MNQQIILNKNEIGKEIVNDLIKAAINVSHKMKCEYCNSKFANLDSLKRHMRKFHEPMIKEEKLYTCDICNKTFPHPSKLKRHTSTHIAQPKTNYKVDNYPCDICDKQFTYKRGLVRHSKIHNEQLKSNVLLKPVILSKDKATNSIKVDNACQMVDYLFQGDEKVFEKVDC